ncbi:MAG: SH3 domain-containing protein [Clostridia bacterium]|nr:SH3 domain-containing protein [Clostridia bacterium]
MKKVSIVCITVALLLAVLAGVGISASALESKAQGGYTVEQSSSDTEQEKIATYGFSIALTQNSFSYSGKAIKPLAVVKDDAGKEVSKKFYTLSYDATPGAVGAHYVKLQFLAPYVGSKNLKYIVAPKLKGSTVTNAGIKSKVYVYAYDQVKKKTVYFNDVSGFSSSDHSVALISRNGTILGMGTGKTTITINTNGCVFRYTLKVYNPPISTIGAKQSSASAKNGVPAGADFTYIELAYQGGAQPEAKYFFGRKIVAAKQQVAFSGYTFRSANKNIVKVDADGTLYAGTQAGTTTVTVGAIYEGRTYYKTVYVLVKANRTAPRYYYKQGNYSDIAYDNPSTSRKENIASSGCGVCSTAMVVNNMANQQLCTVASLARFSIANKARDNSGTNLFTLLEAVCSANSHFSYRVTSSKQELLNHLKSGKMAILNQGESYRVFSSGGHFVVAYKAVGNNIEVFDPAAYEGKYSTSRTIAETSRGCIVSIDEVAKATQDRSPAYYLVSYSKTPLNNSPIRPLDAKVQSTAKNYSSPVTMYCTTTGGLRFRKSASTDSALVQGAGGASIIGHRDAVSVIGVLSNSQGKWYKVKYSGYTGYVSADYLSTSRPAAKTMTVKKGRNLRAGVGTNAKVLAITKRDYKAEVLVDGYWTANGYTWSRIRIGGKRYYLALT